ncbi:MAG: hypothetical protein ACPGPF_06270, partial [Pontibacterium sp.]
HTTRPYIAKGAFHVVAFAVVAVISIWGYSVISDDQEMLRNVVDGWEFILAAIAPMVTLLWSYFGVLRREQQNRLEAASGQKLTGSTLRAISSRMFGAK